MLAEYVDDRCPCIPCRLRAAGENVRLSGASPTDKQRSARSVDGEQVCPALTEYLGASQFVYFRYLPYLATESIVIGCLLSPDSILNGVVYVMEPAGQGIPGS